MDDACAFGLPNRELVAFVDHDIIGRQSLAALPARLNASRTYDLTTNVGAFNLAPTCHLQRWTDAVRTGVGFGFVVNIHDHFSSLASQGQHKSR